MAEMIGEIATTTITKNNESVTVAWPDLVGAYDAHNTEISLWKRESEAQLYYHRLLTTGSEKPRMPWWRITTLIIIATVLILLINHWIATLIVTVITLLLLSLMVAFSVRTFTPLSQGLGSPSLVIKTLESDLSTRTLVDKYLNAVTVQEKDALAQKLRAHCDKQR